MLPFIQIERDEFYTEDGAEPVVVLTVRGAEPLVSATAVLLTAAEVIALARTLAAVYHGTSSLSVGKGAMYAPHEKVLDTYPL